MAEYIEREKAIAICQNYYEHCLETHDYCGDSVAYDIRSNIQGLPTADVVPVVRCKDCNHYKTDSYYCQKTKQGYCELDGTVKQKQGYCSYGERRCE